MNKLGREGSLFNLLKARRSALTVPKRVGSRDSVGHLYTCVLSGIQMQKSGSSAVSQDERMSTAWSAHTVGCFPAIKKEVLGGGFRGGVFIRVYFSQIDHICRGGSKTSDALENNRFAVSFVHLRLRQVHEGGDVEVGASRAGMGHRQLARLCSPEGPSPLRGW